MKPITALAIGGPIDGEWIEVTGYSYQVAAPKPISLSGYLDDKTPSFDQLIHKYEYITDVVNVLGIDMYVAVERELYIGEPSLKKEAIFKAILQRDVATHLLKKR